MPVNSGIDTGEKRLIRGKRIENTGKENGVLESYPEAPLGCPMFFKHGFYLVPILGAMCLRHT